MRLVQGALATWPGRIFAVALAALVGGGADVATAAQTADNATRALDESHRTTANDLTSAQQSLAKIDATYSASKTNFTSIGTAIPNDVAPVGASLSDAKQRSAATLTEIQN